MNLQRAGNSSRSSATRIGADFRFVKEPGGVEARVNRAYKVLEEHSDRLQDYAPITLKDVDEESSPLHYKNVFLLRRFEALYNMHFFAFGQALHELIPKIRELMDRCFSGDSGNLELWVELLGSWIHGLSYNPLLFRDEQTGELLYLVSGMGRVSIEGTYEWAKGALDASRVAEAEVQRAPQEVEIVEREMAAQAEARYNLLNKRLNLEDLKANLSKVDLTPEEARKVLDKDFEVAFKLDRSISMSRFLKVMRPYDQHLADEELGVFHDLLKVKQKAVVQEFLNLLRRKGYSEDKRAFSRDVLLLYLAQSRSLQRTAEAGRYLLSREDWGIPTFTNKMKEALGYIDKMSDAKIGVLKGGLRMEELKGHLREIDLDQDEVEIVVKMNLRSAFGIEIDKEWFGFLEGMRAFYRHRTDEELGIFQEFLTETQQGVIIAFLRHIKSLGMTRSSRDFNYKTFENRLANLDEPGARIKLANYSVIAEAILKNNGRLVTLQDSQIEKLEAIRERKRVLEMGDSERAQGAKRKKRGGRRRRNRGRRR